MMRPRMADRDPRFNTSRGGAPNEKAFIRAEKVSTDHIHERTDFGEAVSILECFDTYPVACVKGKILEDNPGVKGP